MTKSKSQVFRMDFTLSFDRGVVKSIVEDPETMAQKIREFLYKDSENFMFQFEVTETKSDSEMEQTVTKNYHVQGRVNLIKKMYTSTYAKLLTEEFGDIFYRVDVSPTNVHCRTFSYVMKPETRFAGPWANRPLFLGRSILMESQLQHWHRRILQLLKEYDDRPIEYRKIISITDTRGGGGKSSLVRYLQHYYEADVSYVDIWGSLSQISNSIVGEGARKMYLIDLPKSFQASSTKFSGDKVEQLASLLERIKDGGPLKGTMRGGFKHLLMDPPITILFSNWSINPTCFTAGRLVNLNLADLYVIEGPVDYQDNPNNPNSLTFREWNDLNDSWKWFFEDEVIYNKHIEASSGHDHGVQ